MRALVPGSVFSGIGGAMSVWFVPYVWPMMRAVTRSNALILAATTLLAFGGLPACSSTPKTPPLKIETRADYEQAIAAAQKGDQLRQKGQWTAAAEAYKESIAAKPDLGPVWMNLGYCLMQVGDYVPARDATIRAIDLLPSDPRPYENLGFLYHSRGYDDEAMRAYVESLKIDPNYLPSLRGACLTGKFIKVVSYDALDRVNRAVMSETNPDYLKAWQFEKLRIEQALKAREREGT